MVQQVKGKPLLAGEYGEHLCWQMEENSQRRHCEKEDGFDTNHSTSSSKYQGYGMGADPLF